MNSDEPIEPRIAGSKPSYQELIAGKRYLWCRCGRSKTQPFCDGSHAGTGFQPVAYIAKADKEEALFCLCKRTGTPPFCDGTHANLPGGYAEESAESIAASKVPWAPELDGGVHRLDGTCYTIRAAATRPADPGPFWMRTLVGPDSGAAFQTQLYLEVRDQPSPMLAPRAPTQTIIFIAGGSGTVEIGARTFRVGPLDGVMVLPGEGFRLTAAAGVTLQAFVSVCSVAGLERIDAMPPFDDTQPSRVACIDEQQRKAMGTRFFQHLVDGKLGADNAVQFIGHIPQSKAEMHRHLYEEAVIVVSGEGVIWNENVRARVAAGDVIFFPRKHVHSLQCTSPDGMDVLGVIHPGDNPGINY
ncbi:MAG TPA: CDGSH iron-sulfur domain-containing protein [Steroidobacteraceae bacterium]|jgi:CDGSH-type Zn-finger protein/mannose-6-phosphate isomerase-like protein (cupin superfamily)